MSKVQNIGGDVYMGKKAIVFDLDETLRKLDFNLDYNKIVNVRLRPKINALLAKLKEVREDGTDVIICTTASTESANKYFIDLLPEEYRDVFNKIYSKENPIPIRINSKEELVYGGRNKPVTALDEYNQILFFDDNYTEANYLKTMYENEIDKPNKQVDFASYPFNPSKAEILYLYKRLAVDNPEYASEINEYFSALLEEPGCEIMIDKIDEFQKSDFVPGLTIDRDNKELKKYKDNVDECDEKIDDIIYSNSEIKRKLRSYMYDYYNKLEEQDKQVDTSER